MSEYSVDPGQQSQGCNFLATSLYLCWLAPALWTWPAEVMQRQGTILLEFDLLHMYMCIPLRQTLLMPDLSFARNKSWRLESGVSRPLPSLQGALEPWAPRSTHQISGIWEMDCAQLTMQAWGGKNRERQPERAVSPHHWMLCLYGVCCIHRSPSNREHWLFIHSLTDLRKLKTLARRIDDLEVPHENCIKIFRDR